MHDTEAQRRAAKPIGLGQQLSNGQFRPHLAIIQRLLSRWAYFTPRFGAIPTVVNNHVGRETTCLGGMFCAVTSPAEPPRVLTWKVLKDGEDMEE